MRLRFDVEVEVEEGVAVEVEVEVEVGIEVEVDVEVEVEVEVGVEVEVEVGVEVEVEVEVAVGVAVEVEVEVGFEVGFEDFLAFCLQVVHCLFAVVLLCLFCLLPPMLLINIASHPFRFRCGRQSKIGLMAGLAESTGRQYTIGHSLPLKTTPLFVMLRRIPNGHTCLCWWAQNVQGPHPPNNVGACTVDANEVNWSFVRQVDKSIGGPLQKGSHLQ